MTNLNAPTQRVKQLADIGTYVEIGEYIVAVEKIYDERQGIYYLMTTHKGEMPAHYCERYDTLQDLANAMRNEADLRRWRYQEW